MADDAYGLLPTIFSDDPRTGALTYDQLQARRRIALALATRNRPYPKTIGEGLTALGEGLGEGMANARLARDEAAQIDRDKAAQERLGTSPASPVAPTAPRAAVDTEQPQTVAMASAVSDDNPLTPAQAAGQPQMPIEEWLQRVARNESGGAKDPYTMVGERSRRGDYPYGKYQVMGERVAEWSKKHLGKEMTPEEFLANPDAQEQIARAQGSEYVSKYGPVKAAAAWFAGPGGMNDPNRKDTLGTHVAEYERRFNRPLVSRDQIAATVAGQPDPENAAPYRVASLGDTAPTVRDDVTRSMTGPEPVPMPTPRPEILAQARQPTPQQQLQPQRAVQPGQMPAAGASSVPSTENIPPRDVPVYPDPGPPPPQPQPRPMTTRAQEAFRIMNDPMLSPATQQHAKSVYEQEEKLRSDLQARDNAVWTSQNAEWNKAVDEKRKYDLAAPERQITQQKERAALEKDQREQKVAEAFKGMDPKQVETMVSKSREAADAQASGHRAVMEARQALDSGQIITGAFADQRLAAMKLAQLFGVDYKGEINATEVFRSSMAPVVASALKATVGSTQISNADREFAEKAAAGSIVLDESSIRRLLDITQRAQMAALNRHQDMLGGTYGRINPQLGETMFGVDLGIPQDRVQRLIDNPHKKGDFDEKYGAGTADYVLRRHQWKTTGK